MVNYTIEYGNGFVEFETGIMMDIKGMDKTRRIEFPYEHIRSALDQPIGTQSLQQTATQKIRNKPNSKAVIVVSDNTRPVPYKGDEGILSPIISSVVAGGFRQSDIMVLIGAGSHRNMEDDEIEEMLGLRAAGWDEVSVINHEYDNKEQLVFLGKTKRGSSVWMNKLYMEADLKIVTGLVESHFMAGASGGRKGICPGIVGKETLEIFHGARLLNSSQAADLILHGNPLSEEATEVALMAGCDFLVNTTLDAEKKLTGVFAGELLAAHKEAVKKIKEYVLIPLDQLYDIVMIPAGFVGINHYQAAKAAIEASRAVKPGGHIILLAKHTDLDLIGGKGYKESLKLLRQYGPQKLLKMMLEDDWQLIQEQWQVQMWCKVLTHILEEDRLIYCNLDLQAELFENLPGRSGMSLAGFVVEEQDEEQTISKMLSLALETAVKESGKEHPSVLLLKDGPYGIPELIAESRNRT